MKCNVSFGEEEEKAPEVFHTSLQVNSTPQVTQNYFQSFHQNSSHNSVKSSNNQTTSLTSSVTLSKNSFKPPARSLITSSKPPVCSVTMSHKSVKPSEGSVRQCENIPELMENHYIRRKKSPSPLPQVG